MDSTWDRFESEDAARAARDAHEADLILWHGTRIPGRAPTGANLTKPGRSRLTVIRECWRLTEGEEPRDPTFRWRCIG